MSVLDEITKEVSQMTDEQIAEAAAKLLAQQERAKQRMTPERKQAMREREARRRKLNQAILREAKAKGLVGTATPQN